jgi:hypothetical protein
VCGGEWRIALYPLQAFTKYFGIPKWRWINSELLNTHTSNLNIPCSKAVDKQQGEKRKVQ